MGTFNEIQQLLRRERDELIERRNSLQRKLVDVDRQLSKVAQMLKTAEEGTAGTFDNATSDGRRLRSAERKRQILDALAGQPEGMTITQLAAAVGISQPRASQLVQDLEDGGRIERRGRPMRVFATW